MCGVTQQSSLGWTPPWGTGVCGGDDEAGAVFRCSWNSFWGFCNALTGEYQATVAAWGPSNCRHPSTAVPGSPLHSWRWGWCWGLWALAQPLCREGSGAAPNLCTHRLCPGPDLPCAAGTLWVAAAEIAEHIPKWK